MQPTQVLAVVSQCGFVACAGSEQTLSLPQKPGEKTHACWSLHCFMESPQSTVVLHSAQMCVAMQNGMPGVPLQSSSIAQPVAAGFTLQLPASQVLPTAQ